jgi:N-terminal region of Chorein or VPS13
MTSYMYNPSKKVTELLSRYLEFDPEQLQLGIWSGNLSLSNVNLRHEAIYPLLNRHLNKGGSAATSEGGHGQPQQDYLKPPLKFKLISGKIGSLSMKIPWKRLVWGQGDVQVDMRNIVIVLALESNEETENQKKNKDDDSATSRSYYPEEDEGASESSDKQDHISRSNLRLVRGKKQRLLREAERRHLQGRSLGPWLNAMKMKEEEERAKKGIPQGDSTTLKQRESRLVKWLRSTTSDFFWRFYVGLQMNVENVKIVIVQDGIELGIIMPSNKVVAGKPGDRKERRRDSTRFSYPEAEEQASTGDNTSAITPPQSVVYEGEYDDGEYVDKQLKHLGIGVYVRKLSQLNKAQDSQFVPVDVHTSDYILRPVDVDFNFSLFFPLPPDKRKRKSIHQKSNGDRPLGPSVEEISTAVNGGGSDGSSKRRRGKRDKQPQTNDMMTTATELTMSIPSASQMEPLSAHKRASTAVGTLLPPQSMRLSSFGTKMPTFQQERRRRSTILSGSMHLNEPLSSASRDLRQTLPLAQPDDIAAFYAATKGLETSARTARFDGKLSVGAIQMVCSTSHFHLINGFFAAGAKMRNGRPTTSIRSVLDRMKAIRRQLTGATDGILDDSSIRGDTLENDELGGARKECARVARSWWRYVLGVTFWELRQRKTLRKIFQQKYLSFSWQQQSYKRGEYVNLYVVSRLRKSDSADFLPFASASPMTPEEQLLAIEDELPIEQILLYRSIARAVHVCGGKEMPDCVLELKKEQSHSTHGQGRVGSHVSHDIAQQTSLKEGDLDSDGQGCSISEDAPSFLSMLESRCETARARRDADEGAPLPGYLPFQMRSKSFGQGAFAGDEISFGFASESKTIKTYRTNKSRLGVAATALETMRSQDTASGMMFSFSADVKKLELMIVDEENVANGYEDASDSSSASDCGDPSHSNSRRSDVSVLTDDERFFQEEGDRSAIEETEATDPIFVSTDYLLFRMPEKILLQVVVTPLSCSTFGRSGGSRCVNFKIGQVNAVGEEGVQLIAIGAASLDEAPVHEIQVSTEGSAGLMVSTQRTEVPRDALSLSLVDNNNHNFLQCDASTIRGWIDPPTIFKLISFSSQSSALFPRPLLKRSPREEVRLYVLRNENPLSSLNCSIRIHGYEISFPLKADKTGNGGNPRLAPDSFARTELPDPAAVLHCDIMELYSGSAVEELCASMEEWQAEGDVPAYLGSLRSGHNKIETRQLSMLDVRKLLAANRSLLSSHWVSIYCLCSPVRVGLTCLTYCCVCRW